LFFVPIGRYARIHRVTKPTDITAVVIDVAREQVGIDVPVSVESPLFAGGLGLDSIGCLDLILKIEAKLGLRLRDEDLTEESLSTVDSLIHHVQRRLARDDVDALQ